MSQGNSAMPQLLFLVLKFADNITSLRVAKLRKPCRLLSSKHTFAKQNLTQNGHSGLCFGVNGKAIRDYNTKY